MTEPTRTTFVIDTNVLLSHPDCLCNDEIFPKGSCLVVPDVVLNEIEKFKNEDSRRGFAARHLARELNGLRTCGGLHTAIDLPSGNSLRVELSGGTALPALPDGWDELDPDHIILRVAKKLHQSGEPNVVLATGDTFLAIKADAVNVSVSYVDINQRPTYTGQSKLALSKEVFTHLGELMVGDDWGLSLDDFASCLAPDLELVQPKVNQFFVLQDGFCKARRLLARFNGTHVVPLKNANAEPYGIRAMGTTQRLMLESLISAKNEERMVIFEGHAGSGKTLLALASGLHQCGLGQFDRCFYIRSNVEADDTFGFLPGEITDKMDWLLGPVYDNLHVLDSEAYYEAMGSSANGSATGKQQYLEKMGLFVCPLSHVRGRTLERSFIIIDEAQNLSRDQVRMIATRAGHGSTVVLIGDSSQIDTPRLSRFNNGLTHAFEAMDGEKLCYRLRLEAHDGKRSYLSRVAAQKL